MAQYVVLSGQETLGRLRHQLVGLIDHNYKITTLIFWASRALLLEADTQTPIEKSLTQWITGDDHDQRILYNACLQLSRALKQQLRETGMYHQDSLNYVFYKKLGEDLVFEHI